MALLILAGVRGIWAIVPPGFCVGAGTLGCSNPLKQLSDCASRITVRLHTKSTIPSCVCFRELVVTWCFQLAQGPNCVGVECLQHAKRSKASVGKRPEMPFSVQHNLQCWQGWFPSISRKPDLRHEIRNAAAILENKAVVDAAMAPSDAHDWDPHRTSQVGVDADLVRQKEFPRFFFPRILRV